MEGTLNVAGHVVSWAVAEVPSPVHRESGDRHVVRATGEGVLIAVLDGVGQGAQAAAASRIAADTLERHAGEPPLALALRCHAELKGTRGAAMTLAFFDLEDRSVTCLGVGNVEAVLVHGAGGHRATRDRPALRAGLIGHRLPALRADVFQLEPLDTLIMATDGITRGFDENLLLLETPRQMADRILVRHRSGIDDALVLVARYLE
jgi:serine phosphatase RsbU (regulator of sigma subunit)